MALSEYKKCPTCGEYDFVATHRCAARWAVVIESTDYGAEEGNEDECEMEIYAYDEGRAAEKAVEQWDSKSADFTCLQGQTVTVRVQSADGEVTRMTVTGETVPQYSAVQAF